MIILWIYIAVESEFGSSPHRHFGLSPFIQHMKMKRAVKKIMPNVKRSVELTVSNSIDQMVMHDTNIITDTQPCQQVGADQPQLNLFVVNQYALLFSLFTSISPFVQNPHSINIKQRATPSPNRMLVSKTLTRCMEV